MGEPEATPIHEEHGQPIGYRAERDDAAERRAALPRRALRALLFLIIGGALAVALVVGCVWAYAAWQEATWSRSDASAKAGIIKELGTLGPGQTFHATGIRVADQMDGALAFEVQRVRRKWYCFNLPKNEIDAYRDHLERTWKKVPTHLVGDSPAPPSCSEHRPKWWDPADFEKGEQFSLNLFQQPIFQVSLSSRTGRVYLFVGPR
jgi:hypothetical protein